MNRIDRIFVSAPPSFPRKRESRTVLPYNAASPANNRWIPAYAGMTVEAANTVIPAYAGIPNGNAL